MFLNFLLLAATIISLLAIALQGSGGWGRRSRGGRGGGGVPMVSLWSRPAKVDSVLRSHGMRRIPEYPFACGDCFFDSVCYILGWDRSSMSRVLRRSMVKRYKELMDAGDPRALEWRDTCLITVRDEHSELRGVRDDDLIEEYLRRMCIPADEGGLWGDYFCSEWLRLVLGHEILVWLADTAKLVQPAPSKEVFDTAIHLVYHSKWRGMDVAHYEPVVRVPLEVHSDDDGDYEDAETDSTTEDEFDVFDDADDVSKLEDEDETYIYDRRNTAYRRDTEKMLALVDAAQGLEDNGTGSSTVTVVNSPNSSPSTSSQVANVAVTEATTSGTTPGTLKRFSSDVVESLERETRKNPYQRRIEAAIARKRRRIETESEPESKLRRESEPESKSPQPENTPIANYELHDMLLQKHEVTKSLSPPEQRVFEYLVETHAGDDSFYSSRARTSGDRPWHNLAREPLLSRLNSAEHLMMANLRPTSPVEVQLIVEDVDSRFTVEEVHAVIDRLIGEEPEMEMEDVKPSSEITKPSSDSDSNSAPVQN